MVVFGDPYRLDRRKGGVHLVGAASSAVAVDGSLTMANYGGAKLKGVAGLALASMLGAVGGARSQPAPEVFATAPPEPPPARIEPPSPIVAAPPVPRAPGGRLGPTVTSVVDLKAPTAGGPPVVQIAALETIAEAGLALDRVRDLLAGPLRVEIQPAVSGDRIYYRALVAGFGTRTDAAAFCAAWKRRGGECFVR